MWSASLVSPSCRPTHMDEILLKVCPSKTLLECLDAVNIWMIMLVHGWGVIMQTRRLAVAGMGNSWHQITVNLIGGQVYWIKLGVRWQTWIRLSPTRCPMRFSLLWPWGTFTKWARMNIFVYMDLGLIATGKTLHSIFTFVTLEWPLHSSFKFIQGQLFLQILKVRYWLPNSVS